MRRAAVLALAVPAVGRMVGPGRGAWETATPESEGLSTEELRAAEARVNDNIGGRVCYIVVKNGKIVHETYRDGWSVSSTREGFSTTKSQCSSLYGIARQQGWADPSERISARNSGTRQCNSAAEFKHALTMTGTSPNLNSPRFSYDTLGTQCLDSLSDFIAQNNAQRLSTTAWKDQHWQQPLGLEHTRWTGNNLQCGTSSVISCRDLARTALLWANEGEWPGAGQLLSKAHVEEGRKPFLSSGTQYGYTVWLAPSDPVDPERAEFNGMFSQCAHASTRHNTVVVSMGMELIGQGCAGVWTHSRNAIVSKRDRAGLNLTEPTAADIPSMMPPSKADWLLLRDAVLKGTETLNPAQMGVLNAKLRGLGHSAVEPRRTHPLLRRDELGRIDISNIGAHIENITQPHVGIVGGHEVQSASAYPYMACYLNGARHSCGGSLIHPQWVLTAAHCGSSASGRQFSFGSTRYTAAGGATLIGVAELYRHPSYNSNSLNYDGALARLSSAASTSSTIQPVAMATGSAGDFTGQDSTVTGWGTTRSGGSAVQVLREVTYPVISNSECSTMYNGIHSSMLCAYTPGGGLDACQGDSGGPLVVRQNGAFLHVGIVSWGQGCAGNRAPGVYGRTSAMYSWICDTCGCC